MITAAGRFGFDRFIRHHPRGLDMQTGEGGQGLSGGQRQMVALTRMVLGSPRWYSLDEPTTGLDLQTESVVLERSEPLEPGTHNGGGDTSNCRC